MFVANDSVRQSLYRNKGDGTFEDIAVISGAAFDEDGKTFAFWGRNYLTDIGHQFQHLYHWIQGLFS